jgi:hypothetical protein
MAAVTATATVPAAPAAEPIIRGRSPASRWPALFVPSQPAVDVALTPRAEDGGAIIPEAQPRAADGGAREEHAMRADERPIDVSQDLGEETGDRDRGYGFTVENGDVVQLDPEAEDDPDED